MILVFFILIAVLVICNIKIVPQAKVMVVERLGQYAATWNAGIHVKMPFIDRIVRNVSLKEQVYDFPPQKVITKDNVTMGVDSVVYFKVSDVKKYTYGIEDPIIGLQNLTATTLRSVIGDMELDATLSSRAKINSDMQVILDAATDDWGIKVTRVEIKNITPPPEIEETMTKQMKAERERREAILRAEGEKKSTVLVAEGKKESAILDAEAEKTAAILRAEAQKEKMIREAEGIRFIKEAGADNAVIQLKSLEAFAKAADGKATKIIIPSELQNVAGTLTALAETVKTEKKETADPV